MDCTFLDVRGDIFPILVPVTPLLFLPQQAYDIIDSPTNEKKWSKMNNKVSEMLNRLIITGNERIDDILQDLKEQGLKEQGDGVPPEESLPSRRLVSQRLRDFRRRRRNVKSSCK